MRPLPVSGAPQVRPVQGCYPSSLIPPARISPESSGSSKMRCIEVRHSHSTLTCEAPVYSAAH